MNENLWDAVIQRRQQQQERRRRRRSPCVMFLFEHNKYRGGGGGSPCACPRPVHATAACSYACWWPVWPLTLSLLGKSRRSLKWHQTSFEPVQCRWPVGDRRSQVTRIVKPEPVAPRERNLARAPPSAPGSSFHRVSPSKTSFSSGLHEFARPPPFLSSRHP